MAENEKITREQDNAYNEGVRAREYNMDMRDNPYDKKKQPLLYKSWLKGLGQHNG